MIHHNAEELRNWLQEDDVFVADRGFRDAQDVLEDIGIRMEMPAFMKRGTKQMPTLDSNLSRIVTKVMFNALTFQYFYIDHITHIHITHIDLNKLKL